MWRWYAVDEPAAPAPAVVVRYQFAVLEAYRPKHGLENNM